jgi:hypothetical protein
MDGRVADAGGRGKKETGTRSVEVFEDLEGGTLTIRFGKPEDEEICNETNAEVVLMKDAAGRVIGIEILGMGLERLV